MGATIKEKIIIKDFDDVFPYIGGFGPCQWIICIALCLVNCYFSFIYYSQIFMTLTPPHWCAPDPNLGKNIFEKFGMNLTGNELKELTIPRVDEGIKFEKCFRYDVHVDNLTQSNAGFVVANTTAMVRCDRGWTYDFDLYYPSLTSELNWVCEEDWKAPSAQACFFIGGMIGSLAFGWLADAIGRIPVVVATNLIAGVFGIGSAFTNNFIVFCILRFIVGLAFDSNFSVMYILGLEFVSAKYRSVVANVPFMVFLTLSMCAMPWIAYYIHNWIWFTVVMHAPFLLAAFIPWLSPESVRWLLSRGKKEKAKEVIAKAAKINGKELSVEFDTAFNAYADIVGEDTHTVTWIDLLRTPTLRKRFIALCLVWIAIFLAYDGHVRHTENVGANIFISFTIMGAVEFPGDLISILGMEYFGRKHALVWSLFACGLVTMAITFVGQEAAYTLFILAVSGRFLITVAMNVAMQFIVEILPTVGRAQGSSAIHTFGLGMAFISPYIIYSGKIAYWLPYFIFGAICLAGAGVCFLLPETIGEKLPDSLHEGEHSFTAQPGFYNPWNKNAKKNEIEAEIKEIKDKNTEEA